MADLVHAIDCDLDEDCGPPCPVALLGVPGPVDAGFEAPLPRLAETTLPPSAQECAVPGPRAPVFDTDLGCEACGHPEDRHPYRHPFRLPRGGGR